jgi:hypothetical protein
MLMPVAETRPYRRCLGKTLRTPKAIASISCYGDTELAYLLLLLQGFISLLVASIASRDSIVFAAEQIQGPRDKGKIILVIFHASSFQKPRQFRCYFGENSDRKALHRQAHHGCGGVGMNGKDATRPIELA